MIVGGYGKEHFQTHEPTATDHSEEIDRPLDSGACFSLYSCVALLSVGRKSIRSPAKKAVAALRFSDLNFGWLPASRWKNKQSQVMFLHGFILPGKVNFPKASQVVRKLRSASSLTAWFAQDKTWDSYRIYRDSVDSIFCLFVGACDISGCVRIAINLIIVYCQKEKGSNPTKVLVANFVGTLYGRRCLVEPLMKWSWMQIHCQIWLLNKFFSFKFNPTRSPILGLGRIANDKPTPARLKLM